jgi:hypothetical protein
MGAFFIDTSEGTVATHHQLIRAGVSPPSEHPPRPWHRLQGPIDASTMWYAVLRRQERGVFMGDLVLRHSERLASLLQRGWQEVPPEEIGLPGQRGEVSESPIGG